MFSTEINVPAGTNGWIDTEINAGRDSSALESMFLLHFIKYLKC